MAIVLTHGKRVKRQLHQSCDTSKGPELMLTVCTGKFEFKDFFKTPLCISRNTRF